MSNELSVSPAILKQRANEMRIKSQRLTEILNEVTSELNKVSSSYVGSSADAFMNQYNNLKNVYDNFNNTMDTYIAFLDKTANTYTDLQTTLKQEADDLL